MSASLCWMKPGPRKRTSRERCPQCDALVYGLGQHFRWQHGVSLADWLVASEPRYCVTCGGLIMPDRRLEAMRYRTRVHCGVECQAKFQIGERHPNYKGGTVRPDGYRQMHKDGRLSREHRLIMEAALGRRLETREHVHHINGEKLDNRLENLQVLDIREHARLHQRLKH